MKSRRTRFRPEWRGARRAVALVLTCICLPAVLDAQGSMPPSDSVMRSHQPAGLTLQAAVDSALRNNPDMRIARSMADSAHAEVRIARAYPNPALAVVPGTPTQYQATLPIDLGPQRRYRVRASNLGASAARWDVQDTTRLLVFAVRRAWYDVLLADARRGIVDDRRRIMRQLVVADSLRVHAGDLPERALTRSEVELVRAEADAARAGVDAQTSRLALQALMGVVAPDTALRLDDELRYREISVAEEDAQRAALASRPDLAATREREAQSVALQQLARAELIPVPQLSYVQQFAEPFQSGRYFALGVGAELPVLNLFGGQRARAAAGRLVAGEARRRVASQVQRDVEVSLADFRVQQSLVRRYEAGVVTKVRQNVEATRYAYLRGATSLLDLLDALRAQQDVLTDYYTALHDYWIALYALEAAEGR